MRFYIGYDTIEHEAALVAQKTLGKVSGCSSEFLISPKLESQGLLYRPVDRRGSRYDIVSNAPMSTDFANSRFLVPLLCQEQWAFYTDCDVVFYEDPRRMLVEIEGYKAVYVVKHDHQPTKLYKMINQRQTNYPRKNWSSVMLFNCLHPANQRLSIRDVNERPGRDLHAFYWLADNEIGELHPRWNWLVGLRDYAPEKQEGIAHFTLGGPWLPGWKGDEHDELWLAAAKQVGVR
jgi:hypothetical protein